MQLAWQWQVVGWVPVSLDPALSPLALLTSFSLAYLTSPSMGLMVVFPNTFSMFLLSPSPSFLSLHQRHSGLSVHSLLLLFQVFPGSKDLPHACPAPLCHARVGLDKLPLSSAQIDMYMAICLGERGAQLPAVRVQHAGVQVADSLWKSDLQVSIRPCRCPLRGV